jgi:uncharacterized paraquat-inducible protein A
MIDTQVLSFGLATEAAAKGTVARQQRDCVALMKSLSAVRVSSIVVLELMKAPPQVVAKVRASGSWTCSRSSLWTRRSRSRRACPKCGQQVSHQQKTHDALIVATASILSDVDTLNSYDPGVLALGGFVKNVNVEDNGTFRVTNAKLP